MLPIAYTQPLLPGEFYHIYNRGNNRQKVFLNENDYWLFLEKWNHFITPVAKTFVYNLLPNHFHAVIQIRDSPIGVTDLASVDFRLGKSETPGWVSKAFKNFFISYSRKMQNRHDFHGAVFHSPFKRKHIGSTEQFEALVPYIHFNANKHGITKGPMPEYPYSSYSQLVGATETFLERDFLISQFGGLQNFIAFHEAIAAQFGRTDLPGRDAA